MTVATVRPVTENVRVIMTERNLPGQVTAEYEIERTWHHDRIVSETVRETRYDITTGQPVFERRAVEPVRARDLIERAANSAGMLDRWS